MKSSVVAGHACIGRRVGGVGLLALALASAGCGQKGPLVLPAAPGGTAPSASAPAR
jgi:Prokaryotic lipoprotein-attachment site